MDNEHRELDLLFPFSKWMKYDLKDNIFLIIMNQTEFHFGISRREKKIKSNVYSSQWNLSIYS